MEDQPTSVLVRRVRAAELLFGLQSNQLRYFEENETINRRSRCVFVFTRASDVDRKEIESWIREQVENSKESITGLFIVHNEGNTGVFLMEAPEDILLVFLKELSVMTSGFNSFFETGKILVYFDDCETQLFPRFDCLGIFRPREQEVIFSEGVAVATETVYRDLVTLGSELLLLDDRNYASAKENLSTGKNCSDYLKKLPSNERILAFLQQETLFSVQTFVNLFCIPLEKSFIQDDIWPHQYSIPAWLLDTTQTKP